MTVGAEPLDKITPGLSRGSENREHNDSI